MRSGETPAHSTLMTENSAALTMPSRPNRRSIGHSSHYSKRKGMMGELIFVVKSTSMGFAVSKPYSDTEAYDLVIEENGRLLRIQVKSVFTTSRWGYSISVQRHSRGHGRPVIQYSAQEIDFIAAYVVPHDAWYIIPVFEIVSRAHIRLYPDGAKRNDARSSRNTVKPGTCSAWEEHRHPKRNVRREARRKKRNKKRNKTTETKNRVPHVSRLSRRGQARTQTRTRKDQIGKPLCPSHPLTGKKLLPILVVPTLPQSRARTWGHLLERGRCQVLFDAT